MTTVNFIDLLPAGAMNGEEGQLADTPGGASNPQAWDNCGPTVCAVAMQMYGYPDIEPQDWINAMPGYGPHYHGGTTLAALGGFIAGHYAHPPAFVEVHGDPVVLARTHLAAGEIVILWLWCDAAGNVRLSALPGINPPSHYLLALKDDGVSITFWNPMHATLGILTYADLERASLGPIGVFKRDVREGGHVATTDPYPLTSGQASASWGVQRIDKFVRGKDGALWHRWWDGKSWHAWETLGGQVMAGTAPTAVSWGPDRIDVFITGTDGRDWTRWWNGQQWSAWVQLS